MSGLNTYISVSSTSSSCTVFDGKAVPIDEVKKMLITERVWRFMEEVSRIEHDFPKGWTVDGRYVSKSKNKSYIELWLENAKYGDDNLSEFITSFYEQTMKKHGLENFTKSDEK